VKKPSIRLLMIIAICINGGCDSAAILSKAFKDSVFAIDRTLNAQGDVFGREAHKINETLESFPKDVRDASRQVVASAVSEIMSGGEFAEAKARVLLLRLRTALLKAEVEMAKGDPEQLIIANVLEALASQPLNVPVSIREITPPQIAATYDRVNLPCVKWEPNSIEVHGNSFGETPANAAPIGTILRVRNGIESRRLLPYHCVRVSTDKLAIVTLSSKDIFITPDDHAIEFFISGVQSNIPINWTVIEPPPPALQYTKAQFVIWTTGDNKEKRGSVRLRLLDEKTRQVWPPPDKDAQEFQRGWTAEWEKGKNEEFEVDILPVPITPKRPMRLHVTLVTMEADREVSWDARFDVTLKCLGPDGKHIAEKNCVLTTSDHNFDTNNETAQFSQDFYLSE